MFLAISTIVDSISVTLDVKDKKLFEWDFPYYFSEVCDLFANLVLIYGLCQISKVQLHYQNLDQNLDQNVILDLTQSGYLES